MIKSPFKLPAMVWKFELCDARIYAPCKNRTRGFLLLSVGKKKKKAFPEKADWVKHLGKISLPGTWMNQADWQRLPERELPMCHCIRRLSQAPPFTCLLSICYSFWNPFPLPASWTILASLPPCFPLLVYSRSPCPHWQPHPHLGSGRGSLLLNTASL